MGKARRSAIARAALGCLVVFGVSSCAYERRQLQLLPMPPDQAASSAADAPRDLYSVRVVSADVPRLRRDGQPWDSGGGAPDPFVRIQRRGEVIFETRVLENTRTPRWNQASPINLRLPAGVPLEVELRDRDEITDDTVGTWHGEGIPSGTPRGAHWRVILEGNAVVEIALDDPVPSRGAGLREYEIHDDGFVIVSFVASSPLGRAGARVGDMVVSVGDRDLHGRSEQEVATAAGMMMAWTGGTIVVMRDGHEHDLHVDGGAVWQER